MTNNELAWRIHDGLKQAGIDIGAASVELIKLLIDDAEAERWIPVRERLPERDAEYPVSDAVLVWVHDPDTDTFGDGFVDKTVYHYEIGGWLTETDEPGDIHEDFDRVITHWQPLPVAPESEAAE